MDEEIKPILKKHDIAAFVLLHEPGFTEYLNAVTPSYSCAVVEPDGIRVRLKQAEVGKEKAKLLAEGTYNMITHLATVIAKHAIMYMDAEKALTKHWDGETLRSDKSKDQANDKQASFTGIAKMTIEQDTAVSSKHIATDFRLEVSNNQNEKMFIENGLPNQAGIKPLTLTFVQGLVGSIHFAHEKGWWDSAEHIRYIIEKLTEGFAAVANTSESTM